jgi:hypothetical protein
MSITNLVLLISEELLNLDAENPRQQLRKQTGIL